MAVVEPEPEPPEPELVVPEEKLKPVAKPRKKMQPPPIRETENNSVEPDVVQPVQVAEPQVQPLPVVEEPVIAPIFNADYLSNPAPEYPRQSQRLGEQGTVLLRVLVNVAGEAAEVQLAQSCGSTRLDKAAEEAVRRWRFVPAHQGSDKKEARVIVPIVFKLEG